MRVSAFEPWRSNGSLKSKVVDAAEIRSKNKSLPKAKFKSKNSHVRYNIPDCSTPAKPKAVRIPKTKESIMTFFEAMERTQSCKQLYYSRTPPNEKKSIIRPSAPPPPTRLLESAARVGFGKKVKCERRRLGRSRKATKSLVSKKHFSRPNSTRVKTAPSSHSTDSLKFPALTMTLKSTTPEKTCSSSVPIDETVRKACLRLIQMRSQQILRTLQQVVRSEETQNMKLQNINRRKSALWKRLVYLEKRQQAITTCMMENGQKNDIIGVLSTMEEGDKKHFKRILSKHAHEELRDGLPAVVRLKIWGDFYNDVVLPVVVEHRKEDSNRLRAWKKLAPTVNMRMHLKSLVSLLDVMQDRLNRGRCSGKDLVMYSPNKLKKHLDECAPAPFVDRNFIDTYL